MRVYNFSAGPAMLPEPVLERAAQEMKEYGYSGMSVMEMSHRSPAFDEIIQNTEAGLRRIMNIPEGYKVLFLQGGASMQFSMVPMNFLKTSASYIVSGEFSSKAAEEAKKFGNVIVAASSADTNFDRLPKLPSAYEGDYLHFTTNNTIYGTSFRTNFPDSNIPLFADMSSNILSEEMDISKFSLIYAGAQKNIGPAGLTLVILRESLLGAVDPKLPAMLDYAVMAKSNSMYNTPPTYAIYIAGLVFEHIEKFGGVKAMQQQNEYKAGLLYDYIDNSDFYAPVAQKECRSIMNVTFRTASKELDASFCKQAAKSGLVTLNGHRVAGGMRASIYNAMPVEGVTALIAFMQKFAAENK